MINAVFDLSNIFFRSMFIVGGYGTKQFTFDSQDELDKLMRKVAIDVSSIIRQINPSRVIFTLDSRSWRKDISIDENEGYKGHRKKSKNINWDNIYKIMDDFANILDTNGFIVSKVDGAEADDLMALWANQIVLEKNEHVILISADEDIRQLVSSKEIDSKLVFSVVYSPFTMGKNKTKKLFVPSEFHSWLDDGDLGDIFNRSVDVDKEDFSRIIDSQGTKMEAVDGNEIALRKIFCGDDGDNVPAIYTWLSKTATGNEKEVRITPSKYVKIIEALREKKKDVSYSYLVGDESVNIITEKLTEISGITPPFKILDRIKRQLNLVVLNESFFPKEITQGFYDILEEKLQKPQIQPQSFNMLSILEGTKYIDKTKSPGNESAIFKQVDRISAKELF